MFFITIISHTPDTQLCIVDDRVRVRHCNLKTLLSSGFGTTWRNGIVSRLCSRCVCNLSGPVGRRILF